MFAAIAYYTWVMKNKQYIRQLNRRFFDADKVDFDNLLFDRHALFALLMPVVIEQLLSAFMGTADSMMVARAGSAAISAVSLTDSINVLFIQLFAALAAGGTIICSHFIGQGCRYVLLLHYGFFSVLCAVSGRRRVLQSLR